MKRYEPGSTHAGASLLRLARMSRNLSQRDLADLTGIRQHTISHIEARGQKPHPSTRKLLAMALEYDVEDLFPSNGRPPNAELRKLAQRERRRRRMKR
jgi:transcriptional regulator with XRE-family HTH domain